MYVYIYIYIYTYEIHTQGFWLAWSGLLGPRPIMGPIRLPGPKGN